MVSWSRLVDNRGRLVNRGRGNWGGFVRGWVRSNSYNRGMVNWDMMDGGMVDGCMVDGGVVDGGMVDWGVVDRGMVDGSMVDGGMVSVVDSVSNSVDGRSMTMLDGSMAMLVSHGDSQKGGKCDKSLKCL